MRARRVLLPLLALTTAGALLQGTIAGAGERPRPCEQSSGKRLTVVALTASNGLVCAREGRLGSAREIGTVTGLSGDTSLVGIDYRPANGMLYGLGNAGGVYSIDTATAAAAKVSQLNVALSGTNFGVDFNPTVDRLRVVSDNGQNLRVNVDTGVTTADSALNANAAPASGIAGAAYTNNDADPNTATTLFDLDTVNDQVAVQAPPNNGTLNPTGKLGVDTAAMVGFDIFAEQESGTTVSNTALASLTVSGMSGLYRIDVLTGGADWRGDFGTAVTDIAVPLDQS